MNMNKMQVMNEWMLYFKTPHITQHRDLESNGENFRMQSHDGDEGCIQHLRSGLADYYSSKCLKEENDLEEVYHTFPNRK